MLHRKHRLFHFIAAGRFPNNPLNQQPNFFKHACLLMVGRQQKSLSDVRYSGWVCKPFQTAIRSFRAMAGITLLSSANHQLPYLSLHR